MYIYVYLYTCIYIYVYIYTYICAQAFYGQGLTVNGMHANVRLEFSVGATKVMTKPKPAGDNTLFEWYEAVEMECEFPFDDLRDNPNGDIYTCTCADV